MRDRILAVLARAAKGEFVESPADDDAAIDECVLARWLDRTFDVPAVIRITPWGRKRLGEVAADGL